MANLKPAAVASCNGPAVGERFISLGGLSPARLIYLPFFSAPFLSLHTNGHWNTVTGVCMLACVCVCVLMRAPGGV